MSTANKPIHFSQEITEFYIRHLKEFGDSSQGVGWKNDLAQLTRFEQLIKVIQSEQDFSINDFGCGTGEFYSYLLSKGFGNFNYNGYDILDEMIAVAKAKLTSTNNTIFYRISSANDIRSADYSIASGVFNVKYNAPNSQWLSYVLSTLDVLNDRSNRGFSFNLLTSYSDKEFMQPYLYYADPMFMFDYCKKNFSKNIAVLHDYGLFDFTVIVRKV